MALRLAALLSVLPLNALAAPQIATSQIRSADVAGHAKIPVHKYDKIGRKVSELSSKERRDGGGSKVSVGDDWLIEVWIGYPGQKLLFLPDSGAPSFSTVSTLLPPEGQGEGQPLYDPGASSSSKLIDGITYSETFGSGYSDSGVVYQDLVTVGTLALTDFQFLVQTNNTEPTNSIRSGNFGLNFADGQSSEPERIPAWFPRAKDSFPAGVWTVDYNRDAGTGEFEFGVVDDSKHTGDIGYAPVIDDNGEEWTVTVTGAADSTGQYTERSFNVIVDTGTGDARVPKWAADGYFNGIDGASWHEDFNAWTYPCGASLPDFTFGLGDWRGHIPGEYITTDSTDDGGSNCFSTVQVGEDDYVLWGQTWIEALFIVFDWDNRQVGFANK